MSDMHTYDWVLQRLGSVCTTVLGIQCPNAGGSMTIQGKGSSPEYIGCRFIWSIHTPHDQELPLESIPLEGKDSQSNFEVLHNKTDVDHQQRIKVHLVKGGNSPSIELKVKLEGKQKIATALAVIDSGATGNLISKKLVQKCCMQELELPQRMDLINVNGAKSIINTRVKVNMTIGHQNQSHKEQISFFVGDVGTHNILLGTDWLIKHNPTIDWDKCTLTMNQCPHTCKQQYPVMIPQDHKQNN
jgi:hypothetical protein